MSHFKGPDVQVTNRDFRPRSSVLKLIEESLRRNGDAIAMVEGQTGRTARFSDVLQRSLSVAAGLRDAGLAAGDYVLLCGDKSIVAYSLLLGAMFAGTTAVVYPVPHADIMHKLTKGFVIKAVFCDAPLLNTLRESMTHLNYQPTMVATMDEQDEVVAGLLSHQGVRVLHDVQDVNSHVPLVLFSSGTTGDPKGIRLKDLYVQLCGIYFRFKGHTFLTASPLYWLSGLLFFISSTFHNYKVVFSNSTRHSDNLRLLQEHQVDGWFTGTGSLSRYINEPTLQDYDLSSVKEVFTGGEYILSSTLNKFVSKVLKNGDVRLHVMYGNTEGGLMTTSELRMEDGKLKTGACGTVCPAVEMKIVDEEGNVVPEGVLGAVSVKTLGMTPGYWGRSDLDQQLFDKDGYLVTGDAGFFDLGGYFYARGRVGDLICFRGNKMSPAQAEDVLMSHPAVLDAAVVSKPHPSDTHHPTAFVVLNPTATTASSVVTQQDLLTYVNERVEDHMKLRGGVHFLDILPRTIIGKIQRKKLRELSSKFP